MEYIGVVYEVLGQSRFTVFIHTNATDPESGLLLLCDVRKKLKTRYRFSPKRIDKNTIVTIEYDTSFNKGCITYRHPTAQHEALRIKHQLPFYEQIY